MRERYRIREYVDIDGLPRFVAERKGLVRWNPVDWCFITGEPETDLSIEQVVARIRRDFKKRHYTPEPEIEVLRATN